MMILPAFSVELSGSFHTFKLMGRSGENITDARRAAEIAEDEFGMDWNSVFNGNESIERDVWIEQQN